MGRSKWKGPYINLNSLKEKKLSKIMQTTRNSEIMRNFIDQEFEVYNGKKYIKIKVTKDMVGHKFGEFAFT